MKKYLALVSTLFCLASTQPCWAGGSVSFADDVKPLLDQQPALKKLILDTFEVSNIGVGVRLGRHFTELGGARIAPYEFEATSKVSGKKFLLTIHCKTVFVLANGKEAGEDEIFSATETRQTFTHFSVAPVPVSGVGVRKTPCR
ncbi:MAG: hypothetical protein H7A51_03835 [Akkermansiaceae bacterium]|nr:hypothetical protein [Akkermansiaceae bacterium]